MNETSKAVVRRLFDSRFANRYFIGDGIDIGSGPDPLGQYGMQFPLMSTMRNWDLMDGDGQYLESLEDECMHFVHSSHCLEHMVDPKVALINWVRVLKPGGHLVITIPEEDMYEQGVFPSTYNDDHKWTFTIHKKASWSKKSINLISLLTSKDFSNTEIIKIEKIDHTYRWHLPRIDQTAYTSAEAAIEFIVRKLTKAEIERKGLYKDQV